MSGGLVGWWVGGSVGRWMIGGGQRIARQLTVAIRVHIGDVLTIQTHNNPSWLNPCVGPMMFVFPWVRRLAIT